MKILLAIAAGGALGAVARHLFAAQVMALTGGGFPYGILAANVLGSFLMGCLAEAFALYFDASLALRAFLTVGLLGAFTTFSTFSLDVVLLIERNALGQAALYTALSVLLSVGGLFAGLWLVRSFGG